MTFNFVRTDRFKNLLCRYYLLKFLMLPTNYGKSYHPMKNRF